MELLIVPAFLLSLYLFYKFIDRPDYAVTAIMVIAAINMWMIEEPSFNMGLHIYLYDPLFVLILCSALYRVFARLQIVYTNLVWLVFGIIIFTNLYVGLKIYGTPAGVSFRSDFYYWVGALYFMSFQYTQESLEKALKNWYRLALVLLAIMYFRFVAEFLHLPIAQTWILSDNNMGLKFRVTHSTFAYLLSVTALMTFARYVVPNDVKPNKIIFVLFLVAILVVQHRSVWAATLAGIAVVAFLPGVKNGKVFGNLLVVGFLGVIVLIPVLLAGAADVFLDSISEAADRATRLNTGTFGARRMGWEYFLENFEKLPLSYQLSGEPFGGSLIGLKMALHNYYLQIIKDVGIVGLFCVLWLYGTTMLLLFVNLIRDANNRLYYAMFFMLLAGQLTFYIPYSNQAQHGILLGISVSLSRRKLSMDSSAKSRAVVA